MSYVKGLSKSCKNICRNHDIEMHFREDTIIKDFLVYPKDRDNILQKSGVIYRYKHGREDCEEVYIVESDRTFEEWFREYMKPPSPIHDHYKTTGQDISIENFSSVGREDKVLLDP